MENPGAFSESKKDLNELEKTATDATRDISNTASVYAKKAKGQISDLADHVRQETPNQLNQIRASFVEVVKLGMQCVSAKPASSLGFALGVGLVIGFLVRANCNCERD